MKTSVLHKTVSITLTFLVLFSTLSFTVEKHYCGENLVDAAIFSEVKTCGSMDSENTVYVKKSCCKDTVDVFEGQDELQNSSFDQLATTLKLKVLAYSFGYSVLFESFPKQNIPHKYYLPPKLVKDIQLLDKTFLI